MDGTAAAGGRTSIMITAGNDGETVIRDGIDKPVCIIYAVGPEAG